jgi:hypothetical protein
VVNRDSGIVAKVELRASDVVEGAVGSLEAGRAYHDGSWDQG